jgi:hypothetical protein
MLGGEKGTWGWEKKLSNLCVTQLKAQLCTKHSQPFNAKNNNQTKGLK